jgi:serine protease
MSLGGGGKYQTGQATFDEAYNRVILSVAAAGNDGSTSLSYPASYENVISVAAVDSDKVRASL